MKELELVFQILQSRADGVEALGLLHRLIVDSELLDEHVPTGRRPVVLGGGVGAEQLLLVLLLRLLRRRWRRRRRLLLLRLPEGPDGAEEVRPRNGVDGVAELVVEVPDLLQNRLHLIDLHRSSIEGQATTGKWIRIQPLGFWSPSLFLSLFCRAPFWVGAGGPSTNLEFESPVCYVVVLVRPVREAGGGSDVPRNGTFVLGDFHDGALFSGGRDTCRPLASSPSIRFLWGGDIGSLKLNWRQNFK